MVDVQSIAYEVAKAIGKSSQTLRVNASHMAEELHFCGAGVACTCADIRQWSQMNWRCLESGSAMRKFAQVCAETFA